jgi:hypothetical protein
MIIYVSIYLYNRCIENKVTLKMNNDENKKEVAQEFLDEIREERKINNRLIDIKHFRYEIFDKNVIKEEIKDLEISINKLLNLHKDLHSNVLYGKINKINTEKTKLENLLLNLK